MLARLPAAAGVAQAPQHPGGGQDQQHRRQPEPRQPEVGQRVGVHLGRGLERRDEQRAQHQPEGGAADADAERQPEPVDPLLQGPAQVTGPDLAGHRGGGAVGEEDAQPHRGPQQHRGDAEAGELGGAQVTHDGGVGEEEERLDHEGQEGRQRQVEQPGQQHPIWSVRVMGAGRVVVVSGPRHRRSVREPDLCTSRRSCG
jgi:hypothetical protein